MLTIFTMAKPFEGNIAVIQQNAIRSWTLLRPTPEVILFGNDKGTADISAEFGLRHVQRIERNEFGTPVLSDLFEKAQRLARHDLLCYVNADIIFMDDLIDAADQVAQHKRRFLVVGQRWDLEVTVPFDFNVPDWQIILKDQVSTGAQLHAPSGIDYFIFRRGMWGVIPRFAVGRTAWDQWLIFRALQLGVTVIDATPTVCAVHQNHDYTHASHKSKTELWFGEEALRNRQLAGRSGSYSIVDARWELTPQGLRIRIHPEGLGRLIDTWDIMYPGLRFLHRPLKVTWKLLRNARRVGGFRL
ncbi:MAG: hypothetical protein V3U24_05155 [Candidatus Neomarinimicrobiota bacterium]